PVLLFTRYGRVLLYADRDRALGVLLQARERLRVEEVAVERVRHRAARLGVVQRERPEPFDRRHLILREGQRVASLARVELLIEIALRDAEGRGSDRLLERVAERSRPGVGSAREPVALVEGSIAGARPEHPAVDADPRPLGGGLDLLVRLLDRRLGVLEAELVEGE